MVNTGNIYLRGSIYSLWLHSLYYEVSDSNLEIKCPFYTYTFPRGEIKNVQPVAKRRLGFTIRAFGSGGFFGFFGIFYNKNYKWMAWFATDRDNYVLIEGNRGWKLVLSPGDVPAFTRTLSQNQG